MGPGDDSTLHVWTRSGQLAVRLPHLRCDAVDFPGWFIESLATQTLVIFVIRTAGNPFKSRPSRPLLLTVVGGVLVGLIVVVSPLGGLLGFAPLPPLFFGVLLLMTATYLALVQVLKRRFYAASDWRAA